ncbi:hypothetical protein GCM10027258_47100 [Amycolatopsis stemonae]
MAGFAQRNKPGTPLTAPAAVPAARHAAHTNPAALPQGNRPAALPRANRPASRPRHRPNQPQGNRPASRPRAPVGQPAPAAA